LSISIHFFIIILIFTGDDSFPPFSVFQIPFDGFLDAVCELGLRQPAQLVVDLSWVNSIAHVVTLPVCNVSDQAFRFAKFLQISFTMSMFLISLWPPML